MAENFPKIDLHLHLDGSIRPQLAMRLAAERKLPLGLNTLEEFTRAMRVNEEDRDFHKFLDRFEVPLAILQDADALDIVTYDLMRVLAGQGLAYAEIRYAPQLHCKKGMTQQDAIEAALRGFSRARADFPSLGAGLILCTMMLGQAAYVNERENLQTVELAKAYLGKGVVGLDIAGGEHEAQSMRRYQEIFTRAANLGVPYTIHAGEIIGADGVALALNWGARRLGHGCRAIEDDAVVERLADEGTVLEMCLSSNILSGAQPPEYARHSIRPLKDRGVKVTANTDNMTCQNTTLDNEYTLLKKHLGFTDTELRELSANALEAAFMPDTQKRELRERFNM